MHVSGCLPTIAYKLTYCFLLLSHSLVSNSQNGAEPYLVDITGNGVGLAEMAVHLTWCVSMRKREKMGSIIVLLSVVSLSQCALLMMLCKYIVSTEGFLGNWKVACDLHNHGNLNGYPVGRPNKEVTLIMLWLEDRSQALYRMHTKSGCRERRCTLDNPTLSCVMVNQGGYSTTLTFEHLPLIVG